MKDALVEPFDLDIFTGSQIPTTLVVGGKPGSLKAGMFPDFGTLVLGMENVHADFHEEFLSFVKGAGPLFHAPLEWTWAHVAKFFGVMPSISRAKKQGWGGSPDPGFNFKLIKLGKARGEILVVRVDADSPWSIQERNQCRV